MESLHGQIILGTMVLQDVLAVLALCIIPAFEVVEHGSGNADVVREIAIVFGVCLCLREFMRACVVCILAIRFRILQNMKSCGLSVPRCHESPSSTAVGAEPAAPPGGPPRILQNTRRECSCLRQQLHSRQKV